MSVLNFLKKFGSWLLVGFISLSFVAYIGLNESSLSSGRKLDIGKVGGYSISTARGSLFANVYANLSNLYVDNGYGFGEEIRKSVIQRAFYEEAALYLAGKRARELGFFVEDALVWDFINKKYYNENLALFERFQRDPNVSFRKTVFKKGKDSILRDRLESSFFSSIPFSQFELEHFLTLAALKKRSLVGVVRISDSLKEMIKKETLEKYFKDNEVRYADKNGNKVRFADVKKNVLDDYLVENYDQIKQQTQDFYYQKVSEIMMKINQNGGSLAQKQRLFSDMLKKYKIKKGETDYISFFSNKTSFRTKGFNLETDNIALYVMKTGLGKARVLAPSANELKILFVLEEKKEVFDDSSFIFERYKRNFIQSAQNRLRAQYYKRLLDESEVDFSYGQESPTNVAK